MKYIYILFILSIISCSKDNDKNIILKETKFDDIQVSLKDSIEFKFIPLETTNECLIGIAEGIQVVDDRILS